jgi:predicted MPP superfamily phosphohydrolase
MDSQKAVADQMISYAEKLHPAFIVTTGDNFYEEGVQSVNDTHWTESFTNVYKGLTKSYTWYAVLGNHEYEGSGNPQAEIDYHRINPNWNMDGYYSTKVIETPDHQKLRLVFIDTDPFVRRYYTSKKMPHIPEQDTAKQRMWIEKTLAGAGEPWKLVIGHHPVYSSGSEHGNTPELIAMLKPLLEKYKVQAYFCGHDHDLQHQRPAGSYVDYFVSGAGSKVRPTGKIAETKFSQSIPGFADVSIKGDSLFLAFIDKDGNKVYQYGRSK